MARTIGIHHRTKRTRDGEARPTMVAIKVGDDITTHELEDETAEKDFLIGRLPVAWRNVEENEDISSFTKHHCKWRKVKKDESVDELNRAHLHTVINPQGRPVLEIVTKVPTTYDGLQSGDQVAMVLGGSGDSFAAGLSRRGEQIGATAWRIPQFALTAYREGTDKSNDYVLLARLLETEPDIFYQVRPRDRALIRIGEELKARQEAQQQRLACEARIRTSLIGHIFLDEEGHYPEGAIKTRFDEERANDAILQGLIAEEERRNKSLARAVELLDVWQEVLQPIEGLGPRLAAGIIAAIGDIRRFKVPPDYTGCITPEDYDRARRQAFDRSRSKLKAFCGVHVKNGGKYADTPINRQFPRRRTGETSNWNPDARQALYLLADQFNRRPGSTWGQRLLQYKLALRERHPDVVEDEVKVKVGNKTVTEKRKRYTNGHIHKMATWRTLTRFIEWLYREWDRLETRHAGSDADINGNQQNLPQTEPDGGDTATGDENILPMRDENREVA